MECWNAGIMGVSNIPFFQYSKAMDFLEKAQSYMLNVMPVVLLWQD